MATRGTQLGHNYSQSGSFEQSTPVNVTIWFCAQIRLLPGDLRKEVRLVWSSRWIQETSGATNPGKPPLSVFTRSTSCRLPGLSEDSQARPKTSGSSSVHSNSRQWASSDSSPTPESPGCASGSEFPIRSTTGASHQGRGATPTVPGVRLQVGPAEAASRTNGQHLRSVSLRLVVRVRRERGR